MPSIPTDVFSDQLILKRLRPDDYSVQVDAAENGRLSAGRIMKVARAPGRTCWFWTVTGPAAPEAGVAMVGEAETLDEAKAEFRRAFDALLYWAAMAKDGEIPWHPGAMAARDRRA